MSYVGTSLDTHQLWLDKLHSWLRSHVGYDTPVNHDMGLYKDDTD